MASSSITTAQWRAVEQTLLTALGRASHIGSVSLPTGVTISYKNLRELTDAISYVGQQVAQSQTGGGFYLARMANI